MIQVGIPRTDILRAESILGSAGKKKLTLALYGAMRRAAISARQEGIKQVRGIYNVKASALRKKSTIQIKNIQNGNEIGEQLVIKGSPLIATAFKFSLRKRGLFLSVKKGSGNILAKSFMQKGLILQRTAKTRYPIKPIYGISAPQMFGNADIATEMQASAYETIAKRVPHEIERVIKDNT